MRLPSLIPSSHERAFPAWLLAALLLTAFVQPIARADDHTPDAAPVPAAAAPAPLKLPPGVTDPRDATVLIRVSSSLRHGRGSGFVVGDGGWVVTAYHVVAADFGGGHTAPEGALLVLSPWTGHW